MTYIELLNSFWESTSLNPCTSNEAIMYLYLLHQCNIRRWVNPFEFRTRDLESVLKISRATISTARNELKKRGFIDFINGVGSGSSAFLICGAKITNEDLNSKFCVHSLNTNDKDCVHSLNTNQKNCVHSLNTSVHSLNTNQENTLYNNKTDISPVGDIAREKKVPEKSLFEQEEKKSKKSKSSQRSKKQKSPPPTLEEVKAYFLSQRANERLLDWEREAEMFYYHFSSLDWKTSSGGEIAYWDSKANLWIMEHEKSKRRSYSIINETGEPTDKFSERRGTEPGNKSRKGFKGAF